MPYVVLACSIVFFWSISVRSVLYTLLPAIAAAYGLTNSEGAAVASAMLLGYSTGLISSPHLRASRKARIVCGLVLSVAAALGAGLVSQPALVGAAAFLVGVGAGFYLPQGLGLITEASRRDNRARNMGIHEVAASAGAFAGAAYVAATVDVVGWGVALAGWSAVGVAALVAAAPMREPVGTRAGAPARSLAAPSRLTSVRPDGLLALYVLSYASINVLLAGLISVLPLLMVRVWEADASWAAGVIGYTRLAGLIGVGASSLLGDRAGPVPMLLAMYVSSIVGGIVMALSPLGPAFILGLSLMSAGASGSIMLFVVVMAAGYAPGAREKALGTASALAGLIGNVVAPYGFGLLIDAGLDRAPLWLAVAGTALSIGLLRLIVNRTRQLPDPVPAH